MSDIKVGVKLDLSTLKQQARQAGNEVKRAVEGANPGRTSPGGLASGEVSSALARNIGRSQWEQAARDAAAARARQARESAAAHRETVKNNALRAAGAFAGRFGGSGVVTALRAGPVGIAIGASVAALLLLAKAAHEVSQAMTEASQRYAKQLTSGGLPGGFTTKRSLLAEIIGVSENDVMQYGKAVEYLSDRIRLSSNELHRTTRELTAASWNTKILGINLRAYWAQLSAEIAPAINMFMKVASAYIEFLRETGIYQAVVAGVAKVFQVLILAMTTLVTPMMAVATAIIAIGDSIQYFLRQVENSYYRMTGQWSKISNEDTFKETKAAFEAMKKMWGAMRRDNAMESVPHASVGMKRMNASPWERMGLVIGGGIASHPMREVAKNTKKTADILEQIKNFQMPRGGGKPLLSKEATSMP